jgi:hypothetical protein
MTGFGTRDYAGGNRGIHDDIYATALFLTDGREQLLIVAYDICFLSRDETDRLKGSIGRRLDLKPSQILLNYSHNHTSPRVGNWYYESSDPYYINEILEPATVSIALNAKDSAQDVTVWVGEGETGVPMNRRLLNKETGKVEFAPNPAGVAYKKLPVVVFKDRDGKPMVVLFSVSAHASSIKANERSYFISADYPGVARKLLRDRLGVKGAVFLQGAGGSAKVSINGNTFLDGSWEDVQRAGERVASEVMQCISKGLSPVKLNIVSRMVEMQWPMRPVLSREGYADILAKPSVDSEESPEIQQMWARDMIARLDQGYRLPTRVPISAHGISLGSGFRMIAIEGELVADLGHLIRDFYSDGVTMPMGYSDGCQLYLPSSKMMDEGGYEVESYWEYRFPAPLAKGVEAIMTDSLKQLRREGVR